MAEANSNKAKDVRVLALVAVILFAVSNYGGNLGRTGVLVGLLIFAGIIVVMVKIPIINKLLTGHGDKMDFLMSFGIPIGVASMAGTSVTGLIAGSVAGLFLTGYIHAKRLGIESTVERVKTYFKMRDEN